ncbi:MAG: hypothetical protein ABR906_08205 [Terracidiphilus sp.]|jgi:hypothetical protein
MQITDELLIRMNRVEYLFLRSLHEFGICQLEMVVDEAVVNEGSRGKLNNSYLPPDLEFIYKDAAPIETVEGCMAFRLYWKRFAAYLVTEECVGSCGNYQDEVYEGKRFRLYSKSHFLEHLARDTGAHTKPLLHFKIVCEHQMIDVASEEPPTIEIISLQAEMHSRL